MSFTKRSQKGLLLAVLIMTLIFLPAIFPNPARIGMFISCGVASVLAMGWLLILRIGCLSLGQVAFLAIGGYTSALLAQKLGVSPWIGLLFAGIASGLVALGIGVVFLKVRGLSLTIITFALAEVIRLVFSTLEFFGGQGGILEIPKFNALTLPGLGTVQFDSPFSCYYILLLILFISGLFMWRMDHSALGRTFRSLPQNEDLAESLGVHPLRYKVISFVTACFFAGVAGGFTAHYYGCLYPGSYTVMQSVIVQIQATVGGAASVALGGLLGGFSMVVVETFLLNIDARWVFIFYGTVIILITFFLPDGLLSVPREVFKYWGKIKKEEGVIARR
jgi:branched-chain amino acid transport system permease protein